MRNRRPRLPKEIHLTDHEMIIGDFMHPSVAPEGAWEAAVHARANVLSGFHLLRAVRPEMDPHPIEVGSDRQAIVDLAGRLIDAAVQFEVPELMTEITATLRAQESEG